MKSKSPKPAQTRAIVVLGMHRSGTSALTRLVNLLGVELGPRLMKAKEGNNETGFWEHQAVVDAHEDLLAQLGMAWDDVRALPPGYERRPDIADFAGRLETIVREDFADAPLWAVKDPRMCRTLALWGPVLERAGAEPLYLLLLRNPLEIARSLKRRDGLSEGQGLLLWLRHMLEAERATRGAARVFVRYDDLLADWRATVGAIGKTLGLDWPKAPDAVAGEVEAFLSPGLRHHAVDDAAFTEDETVGALVRAVYGALSSLRTADDAKAHALLDEAAARLDEIAALYDEVIAATAPAAIALRRRVLELERQVIERDDRIADRDHRIADRDTMIAARDNMVRDRDNQLIQQHEANRQANLRLAERDARIEELTEQLERERSTLVSLYNSTSWRWSAPIRLAGRWKRAVQVFLQKLFTVPANHFRAKFGYTKHVMAMAPIHGIELVQDGWCRIVEPEGHFSLSSLTGREIKPTYAVIKYHVSGDGPPIQAWLYKFGTDAEYRDVSVRLPMRYGPVTIPAYIPEGASGLRVESAGLPGDHLFRIHNITIYEMGSVPFLLYHLHTWWKEHAGSPTRRREFIARALRLLKDPSRVRSILKDPSRSLRGSLYDDWTRVYDTISADDRQAIRARIEAMPWRPKLSIVMPTYNTPEKWLRRVLDTTIAQLYPDWELCVADDCSPKPHVAEILAEYAERDPRIKFKVRETNGHISRASNTAIELATGEFMVLLDHDDEMPEHALYMVAEELNAHPDADIVYSDEDKIDEAGRRFDPYFKSEFNPDLLLSHNMISHLGVYRLSKIREIGGFRPEFDGSQDYDLALRMIDNTTPDKIRHIPHILYHWRAIAGSVALSGDQKEYAHIKAREAIRSHLERSGSKNFDVVPTHTGTVHRVVYSLPEPNPRVSVIIPTKDKLDLLERCVRGLLDKTRYPDLEIIVVDNNSQEAKTKVFLEEMRAAGKIRVIGYEAAYNYADINNVAVREATGSVLCFLNNDIEIIHSDWLIQMVSHALRPEIGAVGAKLYFPDNTIQHGGVVLTPKNIAWHAFAGYPRNDPGYVGRAILIQNYSAVTAACMVLERSKFEAVGGFDAEAFGISYNDIDLCLRLADKGWRTLWTPFAELYHHQSATLGLPKEDARAQQFEREARAFRERWGKVIENDPAYSPNLSERYTDFTLAFPPRAKWPWAGAAKP